MRCHRLFPRIVFRAVQLEEVPMPGRVALLLMFVLVFTDLSLAQQGTADLRGRVIDQQGAVLPGVAIVVRHQDSGLFREAVSSADGTFLMSAMSPGVYEVTAELAGFRRYSQRDVRLEVGRASQIELRLEVGGLTEAVSVRSEERRVGKECRSRWWR